MDKKRADNRWKTNGERRQAKGLYPSSSQETCEEGRYQFASDVSIVEVHCDRGLPPTGMSQPRNTTQSEPIAPRVAPALPRPRPYSPYFSPTSKKAQITIFLIIGVMVVAAFLFVIFLTTSLTKSKLTQAEEELQLKSFQKEALRIYMDDCLSDELEMGLILLGKQGRIWDDQPGGRKFFEEGRSGVTVNPTEEFSGYATGRVFYGIAGEQERYFQYKDQAYPCNNESFAPQFCQYTFPNTQVGFGVLQLRPSTLEADLKRFLENRTLACVQQWILTNISEQAVLEQTELKLDLKVLNDGLGAEVEYPLKFKVGGQDFFHLTTFDFFYPTQFKRLLDSAVMFPLQWDQKFVDFAYKEETLKQPTFMYRSESGEQERSLLADVYKQLNLKMNIMPLPTGDDLFEFTAPVDTIIRHQPYTFRIARQNRPPALDYIQRKGCPAKEYDYLVVPEAGEPLNTVAITLSAQDADEEEPRSSFSNVPAEFPPLVPESGGTFTVVNPPSRPEPYFLTAQAIDPHGLKDEQTVRILVDRPMTAQLAVFMPYKFADGKMYADKYAGEVYPISKEDPLFFEITLPGKSAVPDSVAVDLEYTYDGKSEPYALALTEKYVNDPSSLFCLHFPSENALETKTCSQFVSNYDQDDIMGMNLLGANLPLAEQGNKKGELTLTFSADYCESTESDVQKKEIYVRECVPHVNVDHLYPYIINDPLNLYKIRIDPVSQAEEFDNTANPFLATHTCCKSDWTRQPIGTSCFTAEHPAPEEEGCFGGSTEAGGSGTSMTLTPASGTPGYLLETRTMLATCTGQRGNLCQFGGFEYSFIKGVCGGAQSGCTVPLRCQGKKPFYYQPGPNQDFFWCHGLLGCEQECTTEIVGSESNPDFNALSTLPLQDIPAQFHCDCQGSSDSHQPCLRLSDGKVGICEHDGDCV